MSSNTNNSNPNLNQGNAEMVYAECDEENIVSNLVDALKVNRGYSARCKGYTWRVLRCHDRAVMCLNCENACKKCPGTSYGLDP